MSVDLANQILSCPSRNPPYKEGNEWKESYRTINFCQKVYCAPIQSLIHLAYTG